MLQPANLLLAIAIVTVAYAWYRAGFRTPRAVPLPARTIRRLLVGGGWILIVGITVKSTAGLLGDGRVQIAKSGQMYAYRTREPSLFWKEIAGEMLLFGGVGVSLVIVGRDYSV